MSWTLKSFAPSDISDCLHLLNDLSNHPVEAVREMFKPTQSLFIGRAPGRIDLMGGIADYSGSLVLQLPTREATVATIQQNDDRSIKLISLSDDRPLEHSSYEFDLALFMEGGQPIEYAQAQRHFQQIPETSWSAYIAGAFLVLMREENIHFSQGANILIQSAVPEGKGVSSSAALEVATMSAIAAAYNLTIPPRRMAILCQMVENLVVGAPCGIMDQMTAACGKANQLLALLCQPAEILNPVTIPNQLSVWGIDSGIRHAVSGADYGSVRIGTFMGYRIVLNLAQIASEAVSPSEVEDSRWRGYLANVAPSEFEQHYRQQIPPTLKGSDFLRQYGGTTDTITEVEPTRIYAVQQPTAHPIYENFRVQTFARLLQQADVLPNAPLLGELMYQSHASYSACGLGSTGTDRLVELARQMGPENGIYGAKITGGGSGGTVAILAGSQAEHAIRQIGVQYMEETGHEGYIFEGSSIGASSYEMTVA